jgi:hypothetical protein
MRWSCERVKGGVKGEPWFPSEYKNLVNVKMSEVKKN